MRAKFEEWLQTCVLLKCQGVKTFVSHKSHIHGVAWHPRSENHVATASLDRAVKLWDLRSTIPLHTLEGHADQVKGRGGEKPSPNL